MNSSNDITIWATKIALSWHFQSIKLGPSASLLNIEKTEAQLSIKFPDSFVELYKKANGFLDMDWNEHLFSIWPLERMIEEYDYKRHPDFIGFCDFLINSHQIGFVRNQPGIFKKYDLKGYENPEKIADSFEEVIEMINNNSEHLY